jgi:hypothetical protein
MDKLEQYLDRVCRSIGGPRSLRQHVRQELREHLLDAAAGHKAAGLSEAAALDRALADFGAPDEVRSGLEATHGHRLLPVVIDKAMQWQERTMKAKWLWASWAYLALAAVVVLEVLLITFNVIFIIPKFHRLMRDGIIDPAIIEEQGVAWTVRFLDGLSYVGGHYTTFLLLGAVAAIGLFEWRVRGENKPFIRLSALGTAAVGLMVVVFLMAGSLVVIFTLGAPAMGRLSRPAAVQEAASVGASTDALERALAAKDWAAMQEPTDRAAQALARLKNAAPLLPALALPNGRLTVDEEQAAVAGLRAHVKAASDSLTEVRQAIREKDADRLAAALRKFREQYGPIQEAAARPGR